MARPFPATAHEACGASDGAGPSRSSSATSSWAISWQTFFIIIIKPFQHFLKKKVCVQQAYCCKLGATERHALAT